MQIFGASILWDRWEECGNFRSAFVSWADDILANYDHAKRVTRPRNNDGWRTNISPALRAEVLGAHGGGVTIRMVADRYALTARQVVCVLRPGASYHADDYVALEEELLANGAPPHADGSWAELNTKHGFGVSTRAAQRLAAAHGIPVQQTQRGGYRARKAD